MKISNLYEIKISGGWRTITFICWLVDYLTMLNNCGGYSVCVWGGQ